MRHFTPLITLVAAAAWIVVAGSAIAQAQTPVHDSAEDAQTLAEVIVTAQKVAENLREVPISISVVGETQLQQQHVTDLGDLTRVVPNFSFSSQGNPGGSALELRGISSPTGSSTVGIYLDEVSIAGRNSSAYAGQPEPQLLDIQQIEVLRGPQGTLYGAGAEGGVVKFRTNPVNLTEFGGMGSGEVSDTARRCKLQGDRGVEHTHRLWHVRSALGGSDRLSQWLH